MGNAGDFERVRKKLERGRARIGAEHLEGTALRDVLGQQEEAVKRDVGGENTFVFLELIMKEFKRCRSDPAEDELEGPSAPEESTKYRSQGGNSIDSGRLLGQFSDHFSGRHSIGNFAVYFGRFLV